MGNASIYKYRHASRGDRSFYGKSTWDRNADYLHQKIHTVLAGKSAMANPHQIIKIALRICHSGFLVRIM